MIKIIGLLSFLFVFGSTCHAGVAVDSPATLQPSAEDTSHKHLDWALGLSLGTPAGLNAIVQAGGEKTFARFSGFMLPSIAGVQGEFGYYLTRTRHSNLAISALAAALGGTRGTSRLSWSGVGAVVSTTLSGFFFEGGAAWGTGVYTHTSSNWFSSKSTTTRTPIVSPQFMGQIGYLYEFGH